VQGTSDDLADAASFVEIDGRVLARGRDPYFPAWADVVQLDAFAPALRALAIETLRDIADQSDGVRCDMAMLLTNDVFGKTWGGHAGTAPLEEFWPAVFGELRKRHPDALLIAEAYWDMEWILQRQGFDFCYDKRLYDRLVSGGADAVRQHLSADDDYQSRLIRFIENHDEARAATALPDGRDRAAAVAVATLPGATLWHDGQLEGRRVRLPVFLGRRPAEPADADREDFYHRLIAAAWSVRYGRWQLLEVGGWPDNRTNLDLLAWSWQHDDPHHLVVVNLAAHQSQGRVTVPSDALRGRPWRLTDLLDGRIFDRDGDELAGPGLYVDLPPWGAHVLTLDRR
jgi:hypothetical protein